MLRLPPGTATQLRHTPGLKRASNPASLKYAASHLRAVVLGHTLSVPVRNGELALGNWQSIILAELDGPRDRTVQEQVLDVAEHSSADNCS